MLGFLLSLVNPLAAIGQQLANAYAERQNATTEQARIAANERIAGIEAQRDVVIAAAQYDKWWSPRTLMGWSVAVYVFKIIVIDTVLGWGVTPNPGVIVGDIVKVVISFYFVAKAAETVANITAGAIRKRK